MISASPSELWPWLAFAGLGIFHGVNPAMGWLFAVALGLHRRSRRTLVLAWVPIVLGHAASVAVVLIAILVLGLVADISNLSRVAGAALIGWAIWHTLRGHRQRLRVGMQAGLVALGVWSFVMATAHGAGLMLVPVVLPLCLAQAAGDQVAASGSLAIALAGFAIHTAAMLATIAVVSVVVYEWIGLAILRSGWVNFDLIWIVALGACGALLLFG